MLKLRIFSLALLGMIMLVGAVASSATAALFTTDKDALIKVMPSGVYKTTFTGMNINCDSVEFGTLAANAASQSHLMIARYTECKTTLGTAVQITGFGHLPGEGVKCSYRFHADGKVDFACGPGDEVTIDAGPCVVHIPSQEALGEIFYSTRDLGSGMHGLDLDVQIEGITGNHTDGFLCPFTSSGHSAVGILEGESTAEALDEDNLSVHLTVHP